MHREIAKRPGGCAKGEKEKPKSSLSEQPPSEMNLTVRVSAAGLGIGHGHGPIVRLTLSRSILVDHYPSAASVSLTERSGLR
jgi:hypothetical protein